MAAISTSAMMEQDFADLTGSEAVMDRPRGKYTIYQEFFTWV